MSIIKFRSTNVYNDRKLIDLTEWGELIMKFYAVKEGRKKGVFKTWEECRKQVDGHPNSVYKSFSSYDDAYSFVYGESTPNNISNKEKFDITAYIDGSYDNNIKYYGYAGIIFYNNEKTDFAFSGNEANILNHRNVAGEIKASMYVLNYALEKKVKSIEIFYDYMGIEKWATKEWKAKNDFTRFYVDYIDDVKRKMNIKFTKVKAHSGNIYNEEVDQLARKALEKVKETNGTDHSNISNKYYINLMNEVNSTKKSLSMALLINGEIYSPNHIYNKFKQKWKKEKRKLNEIVQIKSIFDTETNTLILQVLNKQDEWEIFLLNEEEL